MKKTTIIIITYNGMQWINKCLLSCDDYPIVVIDNASTDGTCSFIQENFPKVKLIKQKRNLGFGQANNLGIKYALKKETSSIFLLNQDAYLFPDTIKKLERASENNDEYGVLSPVHIDGSQKKLDRNFSYYLNYDKNSSFYSDCFFQSFKNIYTVPFVNAAGWFIPTNTLNKIGGFDPLFFHYGEDNNYCQRLKYHNLKIGVVADSILIHDRANRSSIKEVPFSNADIDLKRRYAKSKYANINNPEGLNQLNNKINSLKISYRKSLLLLRFKQASFYKELMLSLLSDKDRIAFSRKVNEQIGKNHL